MKLTRTAIGLAALAALASSAVARPTPSPSPSRTPQPTPAPSVAVSTAAVYLPPVVNKAFHPGEKLEFVIKYEFVPGGTATMETSDGPVIDGRQTINLQSRAESNGFVDAFFKVRDFNGSAIDTTSLCSVHFHQNLKEGHYHVIRNTGLDYDRGTYSWEKIYKGKTTERTGKITQPLSDILSSFFVARTLPLELGKNYSITVFSDEDVYPLAIHVYDKPETVTVAAGKFDCIKLQPAIKGDAIFKAREGQMTLWLTNDSRHMPVLIRSKVAIGAFDAELTKYKN